VRTYWASGVDISRKWWLVDAQGKILGRLASEVANLLRGKGKPTFTPFLDLGDHVIVINAEKVRLTGRKLKQKTYYWHSGYPGGLKSMTAGEMVARHPERLVEKAVRGMLPKGKLGDAIFTKLKVYAGPNHPHGAQQPQPWEIGVR